MKLSVITVNLNNEIGLQETINSVKSQTFKDFEWIVIDGGSIDGSVELLESNSGLFSYWCSEPDKGIYNAMNKAIPLAKGDYLLFLNSGDSLADNDVLAKVFSKYNSADILYGDKYNKKDGKLSYVKFHPKLDFHSLLYRNGFCHQSMFIKNTIMKQLKYDESYRISADNKFVFECACMNKSFAYLDFPIAIFDSNGISSLHYLDVLLEDERSHIELIDKYIKDITQASYYKNEWFLSMFTNILIRNTIYEAKLAEDVGTKNKLKALNAESYISFIRGLLFSLHYSSIKKVIDRFLEYPPIFWYYKIRIKLQIRTRIDSISRFLRIK